MSSKQRYLRKRSKSIDITSKLHKRIVKIRDEKNLNSLEDALKYLIQNGGN